MSSTVPARRVLSDLNINTTPSKHQSSKKPTTTTSDSHSPEKLAPARLALIATGVGQENMDIALESKPKGTQHIDTGSATSKLKRGGDLREYGDNQSPKRQRVGELDGHGVSMGGDGVERRDFQSPGRLDLDESPHRSSLLESPASSFAESSTDMNDTQNTILTEPDHVYIPQIPVLQPPHHVLSQTELREKARAMKLRLSLASYKVRTNQINVPIARLEIRSSPSSSFSSAATPALSLLRSTSNISSSTSQPRTVLPTFARRHTPSSSFHVPNVALQLGSVSQPALINVVPPPTSAQLHREDTGSEEPLYSPLKRTNELGHDGFATPDLPRQKSDILSQSFDDREDGVSPTKAGDAGRNELTSSVVKGRAADGLLSLMRQ